MAKKAKLKDIIVGSVVAFNNLEHTCWFEVLSIDGFNLTVREENKPNYAEQVIDICFVKRVK